MRWYLSGPMSGYPGHNFPAFVVAAAHLRGLGYDVLSAHEIPHDQPDGVGSLPWERYMRTDLKALLDCDGVIVLPGWEQSRGAKLEITVAMGLGLPIKFYGQGLAT